MGTRGSQVGTAPLAPGAPWSPQQVPLLPWGLTRAWLAAEAAAEGRSRLPGA